MKIYISNQEGILAKLEITEEQSTLIVTSKKIQKALNPLPVEKNKLIYLDPQTTVVVLEQLLPALQVMDPILEQSITSPDLTLKRILDSLDDRKILITDLGLGLAYNVDYDTGEIAYVKLKSKTAREKKLSKKQSYRLQTRKLRLALSFLHPLKSSMLQPTFGDLQVKPSKKSSMLHEVK